MRFTSLMLFGVLASPAVAAPPDFDKQVAAILSSRCLECHSGADPKGDLDLSRKAAVLGAGGHVVAGKLDASELWQQIAANKMHDQAIEARTKLQLDRATEEQAQGLEDFKLKTQMNRATSRRTEQSVEVQTEIELTQKRQEAELKSKESERNAAREQRRRDAESEQEIRRSTDERTRQHLAALKEMGVDLTAFLTQGRADRVIELRGKGAAPHLHLDGVDGDRNA